MLISSGKYEIHRLVRLAECDWSGRSSTMVARLHDGNSVLESRFGCGCSRGESGPIDDFGLEILVRVPSKIVRRRTILTDDHTDNRTSIGQCTPVL